MLTHLAVRSFARSLGRCLDCLRFAPLLCPALCPPSALSALSGPQLPSSALIPSPLESTPALALHHPIRSAITGISPLFRHPTPLDKIAPCLCHPLGPLSSCLHPPTSHHNHNHHNITHPPPPNYNPEHGTTQFLSSMFRGRSRSGGGPRGGRGRGAGRGRGRSRYPFQNSDFPGSPSHTKRG